MKFYISAFIILLTNVFSATAQQKVDSIVISRAVQKVLLFQEYLSCISAKHCSRQEKLHFRDKALSLFLNKGGAYETNGIQHKGVAIELYSPKVGTSRMLLKSYLDRLANVKDNPIQITGCIIGYVDVSSLRPHPISGYVADIVYDTKLVFTPEGYRCYDISPHKVRSVVGEKVDDIKNGGVMYEEAIPLYDIFGTYISNN